MEKIEVYYKVEVENYINELVYKLFQEDYFHFIENAIQYRDKLIHFIEDNIASFPFRNTPIPLGSLGTNYIFYKSNNRTTWYIFFERKQNIFLITYITNNHSEIASFLI